tara:strand:+ start:220 stop:750 length:531 start_codon:yes stop_codon:yes gene_type:complete
MRFLIFSVLLVFLSGCGIFKADVDPVTGKKLRKEPDLMKRGEDFATEQGGIFNSKRSGRGGTTYDFATSNIIWRATLESLDFVPLQSANYSGGVLITDWYSNDINSNESIKIEVRFLSDKASPSSLKIISYKKVCNNANCKIAKLSDSFNDKLLSSIMVKVRELKVKDELNKKKKG